MECNLNDYSVKLRYVVQKYARGQATILFPYELNNENNVFE